MPPPPRATLFPYTTLFRSKNSTEGRIDGVRELRQNREEQSERPLQRAIDEQGLGARPRSIISAYIRSDEHTSELQSRGQLVCRLLLEKKNQRYITKNDATV